MSHPERRRILAEARRIRDDIEQQFTDVDHWNRETRKVHEAPIDADPDGSMRRLADRLTRLIEHDPGHGPIAPIFDPGPPEGGRPS